MTVKDAFDFSKEILAEPILSNKPIGADPGARSTDDLTLHDRDDDDPNLRKESTNPLGCGKSVELRHVKVHQDQIGQQVFGLINSFLSVGGKAYQFDLWLALEERTNGTPRHGRVIHYQGPN